MLVENDEQSPEIEVQCLIKPGLLVHSYDSEVWE